MLAEIVLVHFTAMALPGPNVLLVTRTAAAESRRAGLCAAGGVAAAATAWAAFAAVGLAFVFVRVPFARDALRLLGGVYLIVLGIRTVGSHDAPPPTAPTAGAWRRGVLTNLSNPKAAVFYLGIFAALLPLEAPPGLRAAAVAVIALDSLLWHGVLAVVCSTARAHEVFVRRRAWINRIGGTAMSAFGVSFVIIG